MSDTEQTTSITQEEVEKVAQEFEETVKEDVAKLEKAASETVEKVKESVEKVTSNVSQSAEKVKETVSEKVEKVSEKLQEIKKDLKEDVQGCCPYSASGEYSICHQMGKIVKAIQALPCHECSLKIFRWEDLIQTGLLFVIFNVAFILVCCGGYSVISLVNYTAMVATISTILFNITSHFLNKYVQTISLDNQITEKLKTLSFHVDEAVIEKYVKAVGNIINVTLGVAKVVLSCKSLYLTAQFAVYFYVVAKVGKCFSGLTILYTLFLAAFILPRLYLEKKDFIDQQVAKIRAIANELITKVHSYIPMQHSSASGSKKTN